MGRFATAIAASATQADNLPVLLPKVSLLDALLPRSLTPSVASRKVSNASEKPLETTCNSPHSTAGYSEIKKDNRGRLVMVQHRGTSSAREPATLEDVKKDGTAESDGSGKKADTKEEKKDDGDAKAVEFTPEEDVKLKELKSMPGKPWKEIAAEMGRHQGELKKRYKDIGATNAGENAKAEEKKDAAFTAADDAKLRELKTAKKTKSWSTIAEEMGRTQEELKARWDEIKNGGESESTDNKKRGKAEIKDEDNKQQKLDRFAFTEDEDKKLKELMESGLTIKDCAKQLKKGQDVIKNRWEEIGGGDNKKVEEAAKAEEKRSDSGQKEQKEDTASRVKAEEKKPSSSASKNKVISKKAPSVARSTRSARSEVRFTMQEWMTLQEDEFFTFEELQLLCHIISKNPDQSWLSTACKFYDETGRRVHPDDIREKFETLSMMR